MRKRYYAAVLAAGLAGIILTGCGSTAQATGETAAADTTEGSAFEGNAADTTEGSAFEGNAADTTEGSALEGNAADTAEGFTFEGKAAAPSFGPEAVRFDKNTKTAEGDIANTSKVAADASEVAAEVSGADTSEANVPEAAADAEPEPPAEEIDISVPLRIWGTIISVGDGEIFVDNQSDVSSKGEMLFHIDPERTKVLDAVNGLPVEPENVESGSFEAYLGPAMSLSLPPQTTPLAVIVNIPAGIRTPRYLVAAGALREEDGVRILTANDGTDYTLASDAEIAPYLTRNIVTADDIKEGSVCLIWQDDDNTVTKIVLFAE